MHGPRVGPVAKPMNRWIRLAERRSLVQVISAVVINSSVTQRLTRGFPCPALNCHACPAAAFACPIGALQHFVTLGATPFYLLGVLALVGGLVGRAACGWLCPFGWIQELVHQLPGPKWRASNRFTWSRYVILGGLVIVIPWITGQPWFCKLCPAGMLEAGVPLVLWSAEIRALVGPLYLVKGLILAAMAGWMVATQRPFCRWICPLGALWSPLNRISLLQLEVACSSCSGCNRCREVCPVDIHVHEDPNNEACIRCLACVRECPAGCISVVTLGRPAVPARAAGTRR
jgi:ferredoxin-type protein NapH